MNGASNVGWNEALPADTEGVAAGDDRLQSIKTSLRVGLADEHNWPSTDGSGFGYHLKGSARPYYGTYSKVSSDATVSRLMLTSDTSQLFALHSAGSTFVGGERVISAGTTAGTNRHHWVEYFGRARTEAPDGTIDIAFPNSGYSGKAYVFVSAQTTAALFAAVHPDAITLTQFQASGWSRAGATASELTIAWRSLGTKLIALSVGA